MKRFVVGDIHGGHKALVQCFERANLEPGVPFILLVITLSTFLGVRQIRVSSGEANPFPPDGVR